MIVERVAVTKRNHTLARGRARSVCIDMFPIGTLIPDTSPILQQTKNDPFNKKPVRKLDPVFAYYLNWFHSDFILGEIEYLDRCTKRTRSVVNFSKSEEFYENILIGSLSSIPRWRYARALADRKAGQGEPRTTNALSALFESTKTILKGENYTVEHFVNREANQNLIRLSIYASIMRTAVYLSEKNGYSIQV